PRPVPEGGFDPWQRYQKPEPIDIPAIAHRFLFGITSAMALALTLFYLQAPWYWLITLLIAPLVALLLVKQLRTPNTISFGIGAIFGIIGALL
ncbi:MAG: hypothetical protein HC769_21825, partial [Cyanobacteria bacterium CRU_2_1]|nr:hypothetical protein [Cyanobacteria bacterium CRU_2_1]